MSNSKSENNNDSNTNNQLNPSQPEYWENSGIKPIVADESDPDYIEKIGDEIRERIKEAVEELKKNK